MARVVCGLGSRLGLMKYLHLGRQCCYKGSKARFQPTRGQLRGRDVKNAVSGRIKVILEVADHSQIVRRRPASSDYAWRVDLGGRPKLIMTLYRHGLLEPPSLALRGP